MSFVINVRRYLDSAVPLLQGLLNKDNVEKKKDLKRLFDYDSSVSSGKRKRLEQRKLVNYVSNVDVITWENKILFIHYLFFDLIWHTYILKYFLFRLFDTDTMGRSVPHHIQHRCVLWSGSHNRGQLLKVSFVKFILWIFLTFLFPGFTTCWKSAIQHIFLV